MTKKSDGSFNGSGEAEKLVTVSFDPALGVELMVLVVGMGLALGWHPHLGGTRWLELIGLILLGLFAFTTFGVFLGMIVRSSP